MERMDTISIINAGEFATRMLLEGSVAALCGLTTDKKESYEIHGTREELARLHLSPASVFWGIRCVATDESPPAEGAAAPPRPDRGNLQPFGVNAVDATKTP